MRLYSIYNLCKRNLCRSVLKYRLISDATICTSTSQTTQRRRIHTCSDVQAWLTETSRIGLSPRILETYLSNFVEQPSEMQTWHLHFISMLKV